MTRIRARIAILVFLFSLVAVFTAFAEDDEITLYSASGKCSAYLADKDNDLVIYLWSGKPVAYLQSEDVYGFNGKHLGWFIKGVIYNHDGEVVGAVRSRFKQAPPTCAFKSFKEFLPFKGFKEFRPIKPLFTLRWAEDETLSSFLLVGAD